MAMIKCPECGHHISSMAKTCPECGCPIDSAWAASEAEKENLQEISQENTKSAESPVTPQPVQQPVAQPQVPNQPTTPNNKNRRWGIVAGIAVLIIIVLGGFYYIDSQRDARQEEQDYEMLEGCNNPAFYEDFIIKYPNSKYIDDVRARYREVSAANDEWEVIRRNCNRSELEDYAHLHPGSPYVSIARDMIDSLDFFSARNANTIASFETYMNQHPEGHYYDQAESLSKSIKKRQEDARRDSIASAAATLVDSAASEAVKVAKQLLK